MDLSVLTRPAPPVPPVVTVARVALGLALVGAGISHLTVAREEFQAQVPSWFPVDDDVTVLASGAVEIALGGSLVVLSRWRVAVGLVAAAFFVVIFPGNVGQWLEHQDGFGLDTDAKRFGRLFFQPVLVAWALWSTGALRALRRARSRD
ncbi:DoxX family protein [Cellulosimicrobium cellulans]|uniref:DoxX family protein n=1 Tax=Cellulosimicrobium cellulans TaxID=1710 RepID=UPI0020CBFDF6|nr:hypothetical protein NMQ07_18335 [Cellulosimicrobium cellulans]